MVHDREQAEELNALFNGIGVTQWFVHMEYNFNKAAGYLKNSYDNYTRIIGVHWPSDVNKIDYHHAEEIASYSAHQLSCLVSQLLEHQIAVNIVAHSLGCQVVLKLMKLLADEHKENCIEQIILWQAALSDTSLTTDPHYKDANRCVKRIVVLHSKNDQVLRTFYPPAGLRKGAWNSALGYSGIQNHESSIGTNTIQNIVSVDQSSILLGHSHMKIPSDILMQEVYQQYVIGGRLGIQQFGPSLLVPESL
jgi:predicted alpha/beta hydrolase family esterase